MVILQHSVKNRVWFVERYLRNNGTRINGGPSLAAVTEYFKEHCNISEPTNKTIIFLSWVSKFRGSVAVTKGIPADGGAQGTIKTWVEYYFRKFLQSQTKSKFKDSFKRIINRNNVLDSNP